MGEPKSMQQPPGSRHWFITGVSSGLGAALAAAVLARGERVSGTVRGEAARVAFEALAPGRAHGLRLDLTDETAMPGAVAEAERASGPVDVLVNNAGYGLVAAVEEASAAEVRAQFDVNVFGVIALLQAVLPSMRARRAGRIINVSSVSGLVGWPSLGIYSASKFALEGLTETLAQEVAPLGILVTLIEPGGLRTAFATRSRVEAATRIADYEPSVGACRRLLAAHAGQEAGDPVRAAAAILVVADAPRPPLRLLLGADALHYTAEKLAAEQASRDSWMPLSLSIGFPSAAE